MYHNKGNLASCRVVSFLSCEGKTRPVTRVINSLEYGISSSSAFKDERLSQSQILVSLGFSMMPILLSIFASTIKRQHIPLDIQVFFNLIISDPKPESKHSAINRTAYEQSLIPDGPSGLV